MAVNIPAPFFRGFSPNPVRSGVSYFGAAVALTGAGQLLTQHLVLFRCEIAQIMAYAGTAGTGGASTVLDVLVSHVNLTTGVYDTPTSIWATTANKPTMLALNTGLFSTAKPDYLSGTSYSLALKPGDLIQLVCPTISSTGHALVNFSVALHLRG